MKKGSSITPNVLLKRARERQGWSQEHIAQHIGTDAFTVSRWERGVALPSPHFRPQLCALFGLSALDLGLVPPESDKHARQTATPHEAPRRGPAPILDPVIPPHLAGEHGLVGRDDLLRQLKQRLLSGGHMVLSALHGLPGVGKTAIATALAHDEQVRAQCADGILWAGLGSQPDVLGLLSRWGTMLGCTPTDVAHHHRPEAWAATIRAAIGQRSLLLVIDDAWEIGQALAFQVGGPNCIHLVTTRFPEIARRFTTEGAIVVRELAMTDGRLLLMRLAPEAVEAEPEEAQALVSAVGGLPLALTLLGNFLRAQAHSGQPRRLRAALHRVRHADERLRLAQAQPLVGGHSSLAAGTPLSLQAVIGLSDQQVSEEARLALRALSVFPPKPNTFSEEAAVAVSGLPVETLDRLSDAGLLESSGTQRYTLHQTIADYARAHLQETAVKQRLVDYFVDYLEAQAADPAALDRESSNILAALEAASERGMLPALVRGVHGFAPWLETHGLYAVAEVHLRRAQEAAHSLNDTTGEATAWLHLGRLMERRGEYIAAQTHWQQGLVLARRSEHEVLIAETLVGLGILARQQGQPEQARQYFEEALTISHQAGERRVEGSTLRNLGVLAREQGQPEQARQLYEEALATFREMGERREAARTLNNLGVLARQHGQPEQARQLLEESLDILRQLEDRRGAAITLGNLGRLAAYQGQPEQARQLYEETLADFRQLGDRRSVAQVLHNLSTIARAQGQHEQARQLLEEALTILRQLGDQRIIALTVGELGNLEREQGQLDSAHLLLDEALNTFRQLRDWYGSALALRELGVLARIQGQPEQAHLLLNEALDTLRELGDQRESALALREMAILVREQGQSEQARLYLDEALSTFRQLEDRRETALTLKELGVLERVQEQPEQALLYLDEALGILREQGDRREVAQSLLELGILMQQQGRIEEALRMLLSAGVGLALVEAPDMRIAEEMLGQVRIHMDENTFISIAKCVAREVPEAAYKLAQTELAAAIQKLVTAKDVFTNLSDAHKGHHYM